MRLGDVHVVVVAPSDALRAALVSWLRRDKRARVVRSVATAADLGTRAVDCDLVIASALEGTRELRALSRRYGTSAGLVAFGLGTSPLPAGWLHMRPGAAREHVLARAVPHPERSIATTSAALASVVAALAALVVSLVWMPATVVSFDRAALAYAARFPDAGTWWHTWGAGGPFLATASWPLIRLGALAGGGSETFALLAAAVVALYAVAMVLLAVRAGAGHFAVLAALAAVVAPAVWAWPRGGDVASLAGLAGVVLAVAGTRTGDLRVVAVAAAVAVSSLAGVLWAVLAAAAAIVPATISGRGRAAVAGASLGILMSAAVTVPPLVARGMEGLRPALARPFAASDAAPALATAAIVAAIVAHRRSRSLARAIAVLALVGANALAVAAPVPAVAAPAVASTGPHGRLAAHPAAALALAAASPALATTGDDVSIPLISGAEPKDITNTRLEWLGADRALLPDRSSAIVYAERDWAVVDRDRLLFGAPRVRPILTAGTTPTLLVVAEENDARVFGDALVRMGIPSDFVIPVRSAAELDRLTREQLREHTLLVVYGRPWSDLARAATVLETYLTESGFVLWDSAARAGAQPLVGDARTVRADEATAIGDRQERIVPGGYDGRVTGISRYEPSAGWETAALTVGNERVIQYGQAPGGSLSAHLVWSGADLPARAAAGDDRAMRQLRDALAWMLADASVSRTEGYGRPDGSDRLDDELATTTFLGPTHWRVDLKRATSGILFKERYHEQWRALQIDTQGLSGIETSTALRVQQTTHGLMYVTLPPNARRVDLVFERHPLEAPTRGVSALALFVTAGLGVWLWRQRR